MNRNSVFSSQWLNIIALDSPPFLCHWFFFGFLSSTVFLAFFCSFLQILISDTLLCCYDLNLFWLFIPLCLLETWKRKLLNIIIISETINKLMKIYSIWACHWQHLNSEFMTLLEDERFKLVGQASIWGSNFPFCKFEW
jgi:hypothetical protein